MELRSNKVINSSNESPKTPLQSHSLKVPDTEERAHYFWHVDHPHDGEQLQDIAAQHGISLSTGQRWRKEREKYGDAHRIRKRKAIEKNQKLGRPYTVTTERLQLLLSDDTNPVREEPLSIQARENDIPLRPRTLRYNLSTREDAHMFVAAYTREMLPANLEKRVEYGKEHLNKPLYGYWDTLFFTDEAHFNPLEDFQRPRILRRTGQRLAPGNLVTRKKKKASSTTVHMYSYMNWYYKGPISFYNDEEEMLKPPKPPRKPRKSKYETQEQYDKRVKQWEATRPPPLEVVGSGHHMTQDYYTKHILPTYIQALHQARCDDATLAWFLMEDGDPSHGNKSTDNVAEDARRANWIAVILHPAQSPDLNPQEACWLILKQRAKKRLWQPTEAETPWDGTKNHLKKILTDVWDAITMEEIRSRIAEMPWRCEQLVQNEGAKIRSKTW